MGEERERIEDEAPEETPEESPRDEAPASTDEAARGVEEDARISRAVSFGLEPGELEARREALLAGEPLRLGVLRRGLVTDSISTIDPDKRTVELTWSSERAVERWFGTEILDHSPESVDLASIAVIHRAQKDRLSLGIPFVRVPRDIAALNRRYAPVRLLRGEDIRDVSTDCVGVPEL